jgi:tetratricopeptide (TPR) repeat protein
LKILNTCFSAFFLTLLSSFCTYGQQNRADSLLHLIRQNNNDTAKINLLHDLFFEYEFEDREKALELVLEALSLSQKINYIKGQVQSNTYLGYLEQDIGNIEKALSYHKRSLKIAEDNNYLPGIAISIGNIGSVYHEHCDYPQALFYYLKSLKIDEGLNDKQAISTDYGNIGLVYYDQGNLEKAKEFYLKALDLDKALGNKAAIAQHSGNLASLYHQQEDFLKALKLYTIALQIYEEINNPNQAASMLGNIGEVYHDLAKSEKKDSPKTDSLLSLALKYHFQALEIKQRQNDTKGVTINKGNIGAVFIKLKKHKEAEMHLLQALILAKEIRALDILLAVENLLSDLYFQTSRYQLSLQHFKQYNLLKDSIFNKEKEKELIRHEMTYEFEKKEALIKADQDKKEAIAATDKRDKNYYLFWLHLLHLPLQL